MRHRSSNKRKNVRLAKLSLISYKHKKNPIEKSGFFISVIKNYNGMLPCLRLGLLTSLFSSILNAFISFLRVFCGKITSSM